MSMFKTMQSLRGALTLFHDPSSAASTAILKNLELHFPDPAERKFDVQVTEEKPTQTQLNSITEIDPKITEANFKRPLLVDWFNAKTANNESTAQKIFDALKQ